MLALNQKKILKLLAINSRYSNKDIAKSVGMSEDTVHYQIKKFIDNNLLSFVNNFNFKELGFDEHHYLIRFKDLSKIPIEKLKLIPQVFWINTSSGNYDMQIIFCHRNDDEFIQIKNTIDSVLSGNVAMSIILKFYSLYKFTNLVPEFDINVSLPKNSKNALYKLNKSDWHSTRTDLASIVNFTDGELRTIRCLLDHPRASYSDLGRKTSQSYETIRQQIHKFVENKYIGNFGMFPNFEELGYYTNYILLNTESVDEMKLRAYISNNKNIFFAARLIGQFNILLYFVSKQPSELHEEIRNIRSIFCNQVISLEMLSFDIVHKSVQFPTVLFNDLRK